MLFTWSHVVLLDTGSLPMQLRVLDFTHGIGK